MGHVIDTERTFAYRALCFARKDPAELPSVEQDQYAEFSNAASRTLPDLAEELRVVRKSHVALFKSFDETGHRERIRVQRAYPALHHCRPRDPSPAGSRGTLSVDYLTEGRIAREPPRLS